MELTACEEHSAYAKERLRGQCKGFTFFFFFFFFFWSPGGGGCCSSVQIGRKQACVFCG